MDRSAAFGRLLHTLLVCLYELCTICSTGSRRYPEIIKAEQSSSWIGTVAPIDFLPTYAPLEVVEALSGGGNSFKATTAVDAWGIGMIRMELLLQRTVPCHDNEAVREVCLPVATCLRIHWIPQDIPMLSKPEPKTFMFAAAHGDREHRNRPGVGARCCESCRGQGEARNVQEDHQEPS